MSNLLCIKVLIFLSSQPSHDSDRIHLQADNHSSCNRLRDLCGVQLKRAAARSQRTTSHGMDTWYAVATLTDAD